MQLTSKKKKLPFILLIPPFEGEDQLKLIKTQAYYYETILCWTNSISKFF